ncbi:MAG: tRNA (adenosine(37)-N6)-threonylcarbamoyltransferase complex ATPase subunit type 1 TsaE [Candidatus Nitronauta litoralis]|uniref:tRNA threonylcarbamoyladenosine biosynthesis protein TsaE n=1 Tax=Candidatus Nitronauta litoralis TaxID=2705533 RepID=A0A7T0BZ13_9BACT|nr:MAG: tRNA (adenosine(37)-N6)-threonylcarbamoyltransferase complex ATPase subunit type 1 TsaE [Candidatus Nitronauta litoralis]
MQFITKTAEESIDLGIQIGKCLEPGDCVLLFGDLGAGKTTLTLGLSRGLGLPETEYVRSPTFTLINQYEGRYPIFHLDLYRIESFEELDQLGLDEVFSDEGVCIVEWAEKLKPPGDQDNNLLPFGIQSRLEIDIQCMEDEARKFEITPINYQSDTHPIFSLQ